MISAAQLLVSVGERGTLAAMSSQVAFHRGLQPVMQLLLPGKEQQVLAVQADPSLRDRMEELARQSTEGELAPEDREEYAGYVRANKFIAVLRREAKRMTTDP